jgi:acyl-Coa thioesterase superfamily protein/acyl-CoA thioesterase superfamily protein
MIGATSLGFVADSYFAPIEQTDTSGRYLAGPATSGPWAAHLQHGGPPNALAVAAAERALRAETGRDDFVALRLAADFVRAVPVDEIETQARVVRAARSAALVQVVVTAQGRVCLETRVWFVRRWDTSSLAAAPTQLPTRPEDESPLEFEFGYGASLEWHFVSGRMSVPGPATAWVRPTLPLIAGHEYSGLSRVALIADSASGISAELDWSAWSFVNVDLDIHLARPFTGEWLLMEAATQLGPDGSALARSTLSDERGIVGSGLQTLVLAIST